MKRVTAQDFTAYFQALHGYAPFPWQRRLAKSLVETGVWPDLLDIPTGLGKTSVIDIALFALAARPEIAPRRVILVVDRRVVVDQAAAHARKIQAGLSGAQGGPLQVVAAALRALWEGDSNEPPFEVAVLRGGMPRDEAWAQRPDRPVVALSTVDQVGSRILFRGYGVSSGMSPIHAGLLGQDALIFLDEVQLSSAFAETLSAIGQRWRCWHEREDERRSLQLPQRWGFVQMSATPIGTAELQPHTLDPEDLAHPVIKVRREAHKVAVLAEPIVTSKSDPEAALKAVVQRFTEETTAYATAGARRVLVIVNRVGTARAIHTALKPALAGTADVALLTGRMRPLDRMELFGDASDPQSLASRVMAGADREVLVRPIVVVSTQTIEAGADYDFDALVTECASLDALKQRFGRLDRRGDLQRAGQPGVSATILVRKDQLGAAKPDPVYGSALAQTWAWLNGAAGASKRVDFGIAHLPIPRGNELPLLCSDVRHAPVMLPAHLDAWSCTNPRGAQDPDVALWLHGPERGSPEVRIVWRADITEALLNSNACESSVMASLAAVPPSSLESISVSLAEFRAWIEGEAATDFADVEGAASDDHSERRSRGKAKTARPYLVVSMTGVELRTEGVPPPESTIVVPASYGGIRDGNWNPEAKEPVRDLGDFAQLVHRGRPVLRLVPAVVSPWLVPEVQGAPADVEETAAASLSWSQSVPESPATDDPEFLPIQACIEWLEGARFKTPGWRLLVDTLLANTKVLRAIALPGSGYFAVSGVRLPAAGLYGWEDRVDTTSDIVNDHDDSASHIGQEVGLEEHLADVERWVRRFALNVHLPEVLAADLALAARLHDIGKADPRFQQMLRGGSPIKMAAAGSQLLAKSSGDARDRQAREQARRRAGYPKGYRHELLSVAMLEANASALGKANDPELVLHLVGSHHGWCRPFAPVADPGARLGVTYSLDGVNFAADTAHRLASFGSGVAERYWRVTERYGWWMLAWFEALVRLADHRASEERSAQVAPAKSTPRRKGTN